MSAPLKLTHKTIGVEGRRGTCDAVVDGEACRDPRTERDHRHTGRTWTAHSTSPQRPKLQPNQDLRRRQGEIASFRCSGKSILPNFLLSQPRGAVVTVVGGTEFARQHSMAPRTLHAEDATGRTVRHPVRKSQAGGGVKNSSTWRGVTSLCRPLRESYE